MQRPTQLLRAALTHPGRALVVCIIVLVAAAAYGGPAPERLAETPGDDFADSSLETFRTFGLLDRTRPDSGVQAMIVVDFPKDEAWPSADAQERVADVTERITDTAPGASIVGPAQAPDRFTSDDGRSALLAVSYTSDAPRVDSSLDLREEFADDDDITVGGAALVQEDIGLQVGEDLAAAELFAFPLLILASMFVFRSFIAALLPLITGIAAIVLTFAGLVVFNSVEPMSVFAVNLVFALGLGLAVDYSLLVLTRRREARAAGHGPRGAAFEAARTTAPTILFSALTVASAMAALTLFPQRFLWSMGVGGVMCSLFAALASTTLLPIVLALLGDRIDWLQPKRWRRAADRDAQGESTGAWAAIARFVMRRPGTVTIVTGALLLLAASPVLRVDFTGVDATVLPESSPSRQVADRITEDFEEVGGTSLSVVARDASPEELTSAVRAALQSAPAAARTAAGDLAPAESLRDGVTLLDVPIIGHPNSEAATDLARAMRTSLHRDDSIDFVGISSPTTVTIDTLESFGDHLPWAILLIVITTFVLVFLFTGSLVLPIKAILMNVLSIGVGIGVLVLIFQDGRFEDLIGFTSQGALESSQPILIGAIAFGLSTDYGIILLGRIREERERGHGDRDAVAIAIQRTGRIVTAAALLLSIALGAFVTSQIVFIQQVGIGTVTAVIVDATIVRALLVPSLMALLGKWNWWAPAPLRSLHRRFGVREAHGIEPPAAGAPVW